jgi:hypothetical protein
MPFCMTATNKACPQCLVPLVAETAGACDAACPQCLMPFLTESAGACHQMTQLARDVSCPCWPRLLGLAVHKVSLPAILKPLWRNHYSACCKKISSSPAVSCLLAVTVAGLLFECCFDFCAAVAHLLHDYNCQRSSPMVSALGHDCSLISCRTFLACPRCLVPLLAMTAAGLL